MKIKQTEDVEVVKEILSNSDICDRLTGDDNKWSKDNLPTGPQYRYLLGVVDKVIIGVNIFCDKGEYTIVHFNVLPKYRFKHAREFAKLCLQVKGDKPLFAITPNRYKSIINFCLNLGFEKIGEHETPFIKNGVEYKQTITRFKDGVL